MNRIDKQGKRRLFGLFETFTFLSYKHNVNYIN